MVSIFRTNEVTGSLAAVVLPVDGGEVHPDGAEGEAARGGREELGGDGAQLQVRQEGALFFIYFFLYSFIYSLFCHKQKR